MNGKFGCPDTIVREFDKWLSSGGRSGGSVPPRRLTLSTIAVTTMNAFRVHELSKPGLLRGP